MKTGTCVCPKGFNGENCTTDVTLTMTPTASGTMSMPVTILTGHFIKERHPRKTQVQHMTILQELPKANTII
ncbi:hypothetical protein DPMN_087301 [Dreissena polymorpha]|uniref:EGF-like domain-containing protein n=1 Tax=Dreissena polymorpha TaxID=45954 RepID=A0A9D4KS52_DREPO|nr:hypothetical protein DPMN_087301 [Dreissena polymorpha]